MIYARLTIISTDKSSAPMKRKIVSWNRRNREERETAMKDEEYLVITAYFYYIRIKW